jgi:hypothetical protein
MESKVFFIEQKFSKSAISNNFTGQDGFVQIWELAEDAISAHVVAHISLKDEGDERYLSGCCASALWLTNY